MAPILPRAARHPINVGGQAVVGSPAHRPCQLLPFTIEAFDEPYSFGAHCTEDPQDAAPTPTRTDETRQAPGRSR